MPRAQKVKLAPAVEGSRRQVLEALRRRIAEEIDSGTVASHALARLIAELSRIDAELRTPIVDDVNDEEDVEDGEFDYSAI
ncbi:hypothetical protein [Curtobacterium sp. MCLR17_042]|uniref:hypothetical protein n=1 Tax=Curtobacterium sp. MCLR17_042 TaxID=2175626 RepID=UPI0015E8E967|nr:hypothetical protein [Curtobacterium sp. MCLR17_042]